MRYICASKNNVFMMVDTEENRVRQLSAESVFNIPNIYGVDYSNKKIYILDPTGFVIRGTNKVVDKVQVPQQVQKPNNKVTNKALLKDFELLNQRGEQAKNQIAKEQELVKMKEAELIKKRQANYLELCEFINELSKVLPKSYKYRTRYSVYCSLDIEFINSDTGPLIIWYAFDSNHKRSVVHIKKENVETFYSGVASMQVKPLYEEFLDNWKEYIITGSKRNNKEVVSLKDQIIADLNKELDELEKISKSKLQAVNEGLSRYSNK